MFGRQFPLSSHRVLQQKEYSRVRVYDYSKILNKNKYCIFYFTDIRSNIGHRENRHSFAKEVKRKHLITTQDIANIKRKVIDHTIMRHEDDALSVKMIVSECRKEAFDPILLYKPQHSSSPDFPSLPVDAFVLAIQTNW